MRLATYEYGELGTRHIGVVHGDRVIDLRGLAARVHETFPQTMLELIERGWAADLPGSLEDEGIPIDEVRLCAPIPRPTSNVICLGRNYAEHAEESARARREEVDRPTFFTKAITSIAGPCDDVPFDPDLSSQIDWEVELGVIIGRRAKWVSATNALEYVFGYTVLNDVSARDLQFGYGGQYFYGKSLDGSCPIGPWIVTADEVPDPQALTLRLRVNGITKQESGTRDMIFGVADIVEILSRAMTLEPGQIIATGTPAGVGFARKPPEFLKPGDLVESEIDGLGVMRNHVVHVSR